MAKRRKKKGDSSGKKIRVDFRRNRAKPAREKDWTQHAPGGRDEDVDPHDTERVVAKGALSRKRTVIVDERGERVSLKNAKSGVVITLYGRVAEVDDGARVWPCTVRRILRTRSIDERNAVTVGDRVRFTVPEEREGVEVEGVIESVEPRHGELTRRVARREHTVVANVDRIVIVASADEPGPKPHLIDRYIVAALHGGIEPVICLNKIDLVDGAFAADVLAPYRALGYRTLMTCASDGRGIDELRDLLKDNESAVAGQSGVGKSSLLNAVQPGLGLATGQIVADTSKGRHTTTRATLLRLDVGGYVVDTPGVKSFDMSCVPRGLYEQYFVEFIDLVAQCKFPDCTHVHEFGCAVKDAVEAGGVHPDRYESYVRLFTDTEFRGNISY